MLAVCERRHHSHAPVGSTPSQIEQRFGCDDNDIRSCKYMRARVNDAYNKLSTYIYDGIQALQNNIANEMTISLMG